MSSREEFALQGVTGDRAGYAWHPDGSAAPSWIAVLVHGYGEHAGRYEHVADRLLDAGAAVYAVDHEGHGKSAGEPVLIGDFEPVVSDVHTLVDLARQQHPDLPVVLIGHSMGGMIAARYGQRYGEELAAIVLSGPVLGRWDPVTDLLGQDPIPETPIDPATLSRDPAVGEAYVADPLVWHGAFKRSTVQALANELATIDAGGTIDRPLLWLHGGDDQLVPIEGTTIGWPAIEGSHAQSKVYPGARHEIFNETTKDEVLDDVIAFVQESLGTTST